MIKKILLLSLTASFIVSCSGKGKILSITEFTEKLSPNSNHKVLINDYAPVPDFYNQLSFLNNNKSGAAINLDEISKYKFSKLGFRENLASMPSVIDGNIYLLSKNGKVSSYNIETKKLNWSLNIPIQNSKLATGTLSFHDNKLIVAADLQIFVLDAVSGKELNRKSLDDISRNYPAINGNAFVTRTVNNNLFAYNTENWKLVWMYDTWPEYISSSTITSPLIYQGMVITGFSTGQLVANRISDGAELWQMNLARESDNLIGYNPVDLSCQPIIRDQYIYIASNNGFILKIDLTNASIIWKSKVQDVTSMNIFGNSIFLTNNARQIASLSILDGSVIWTNNLTDAKNQKSKNLVKPSLFTSPLATNHGVYVFSSDGHGFLFSSSTGELIKDFIAPAKIQYFAIHKGKLVVFNEDSGYILD